MSHLNQVLMKRTDRLPPGDAAIRKSPTRCQQLKHMIGNTTLLAVHFRYRGKERVIYAKAEHLNLTGSIKDRMAFHILKRAYQEGHIQPGDTIAEATSGNTGISFAAIGRPLGHRVVIFMPDWMSQERVALIRSLGAKIVPVRRDQGGFVGSIRMTEELAEHEPHVFFPPNLRTKLMSKRISKPPVRKSGGNCIFMACVRMHSLPVLARAARSWVSAGF